MIQKFKRSILSTMLWDCANPEVFSRRLNWYCYLRRRSLRVSWEKETQTFKLYPESGGFVHLGRVNRIKEKYVSGGDRLNTIYKKYLLQDLKFHERDVVIDVGANVGELSLYLVRNFGVIPVCCEPDPVEVRCLKANLDGHDFELFSEALWSEAGELEFFLDNDHGDSSLIANGRQRASIRLECTTLDLIFSDLQKKRGIEKITLLKIEAEGAEPEILKGGEKMLEQIQFISADLGPERGKQNANTIPECVNFLLERNFRVLKADPKRAVFLFGNRRFGS